MGLCAGASMGAKRLAIIMQNTAIGVTVMLKPGTMGHTLYGTI